MHSKYPWTSMTSFGKFNVFIYFVWSMRFNIYQHILDIIDHHGTCWILAEHHGPTKNTPRHFSVWEFGAASSSQAHRAKQRGFLRIFRCHGSRVYQKASSKMIVPQIWTDFLDRIRTISSPTLSLASLHRHVFTCCSCHFHCQNDVSRSRFLSKRPGIS